MKNKLNKFNYDIRHNNLDDETAVLKFSVCDDKYPLYELSKTELKDFISFAKKIESLPWRTIKTYNGLKYENIKNINRPDNIEKDITLSSLRINEKFRLIGYRQEQYFYIVWFDHNHEVYYG